MAEHIHPDERQEWEAELGVVYFGVIPNDDSGIFEPPNPLGNSRGGQTDSSSKFRKGNSRILL
jgi:hypothetical protein